MLVGRDARQYERKRKRVMAESLADPALGKLSDARQLYHRLILLLGPAGSRRARVLQELSAASSAPLSRVDLELSGRLPELSERQPALRTRRLLSQMAAEANCDPVPFPEPGRAGREKRQEERRTTAGPAARAACLRQLRDFLTPDRLLPRCPGSGGAHRLQPGGLGPQPGGLCEDRRGGGLYG